MNKSNPRKARVSFSDQLPTLDRVIYPPRDQYRQRVMDGHGRHEVRMGVVDRAEAPARLDVVYAHGAIVAAAQNVVAGGMYEDAPHPVLMGSEGHEA